MTQTPMTPLTANVDRSQADRYAEPNWVGWFFLLSSLFWPRVVILAFWIFSNLLGDAYDHGWVIPVIGFVVAPWTTMTYALMWGLTSDGVSGWEWICVGVAVLFDLATWVGGRNLVRG
jgi:hypothetical protein